MKVGRAAGPSKVSAETIVTSGEIRIGVMVELCQGVLDGRGMPDDWVLSVVVPIFKGKGDAMNCMAYRGVKLLEHSVKIVEKEQVRTLWHMPGKGMIDAVFILRRLQEEYLDTKKKLYNYVLH